MPSRRDFLKGVIASGAAAAAAAVAKEIPQPEPKPAKELMVVPDIDSPEILLYWYCPECGAMNTQRHTVCKMCKAPFSEGKTIKTVSNARSRYLEEVWWR